MNQSTKLAETATGSLSTCRAFERLKIDYWCRGKASLADVAGRSV
jgi:hypothetical protein